MSVYYYLINKTKKERLHFDNHIKSGPICFNSAVHQAFINYMFENQGDDFTILSDVTDDCYVDEFEEIDLKNYNFEYPGVNEEIMNKLKAESNQ